MKAVLLVGGMGTRLRPLTYRIPKPLIPVIGKPLIMHVIDSLPKEVDEVIIPIGYKKKSMEEYLVKNPPRRKITLVDEHEPMGTGGAVKNVEDHIDGRFLVINGDSISSLDIAKLIDFHRTKKAFATISLWPVENPTPYGVVDLDVDKRIRRFQEKPKREEAFSNLINAGAYALEREILDYIGKGFVSMEREVFPKVLDRGMYGMEFEGYWIDCGRREDLLRAFWTLMGNDMVHIDRRCVHEGAVVRGPVTARAESVIAGAVIGPRAYISERAVVGPASTVERSVLLEDARVGTRCTIVDSIVDAGVTVPDGARITSHILSNAGPDAE
ncbi:MAG: NDP-sugar synthase [Candidatus Thermoplasmatota archaeon]|nr:NDP-sugar synthase [Candidatus Thermoplasmatota archaeon]